MPKSSFRRAVCTFHDLFVLTGDYSSSEFRCRFAVQAREAADRSDLIIAVSEFTAGQVEDLLRIARSKIRVIPHGIRRRRRSEEPTEASKERIILHVGAIQRRKNIARLVEAFERVDPGWTLVLAGSLGYGAEEILRRIEQSPRHREIQVMGYVGDAKLEELYKKAMIFAFPSLDEGFGMPVLEAMAAGIPVLTSNRSAMPEVSGDAALLADPTKTEEIINALQKLTTDRELRERMIHRGLARSAAFTWQSATTKTWAVYQELLD
jgi:glycosyltransferase involved in cell wall biosynthesis